MFHRPPEARKNEKWDVYSFGVMFAGVVLRSLKVERAPFVSTRDYTRGADVVDDATARLVAADMCDLAELLCLCTRESPIDRISATEIVQLLVAMGADSELPEQTPSPSHTGNVQAALFDEEQAEALREATSELESLRQEIADVIEQRVRGQFLRPTHTRRRAHAVSHGVLFHITAT